MDNYLERHWHVSQPALGHKIEELLEVSGGAESDSALLYRDMLWSVMRMIQGNADRWDAKIAAKALRELERAFNVFAQFRRRRKVTVFGSARAAAETPVYKLARRLGACLAEDDFMVITGAGPGVMHAANEGAGAENSIGLNINLPFEQDANSVLTGSPGLVEFQFFFTRKLFFVKEADAVVLFPGGYGTLDEALELLTLVQTGKSPIIPIILLDVPGGTFWRSWRRFVQDNLLNPGYIAPSDMALFRFADSPEAVRDEIEAFYSVYHSSRWINRELRLRLNRPLSELQIQALNQEFADILSEGRIELTGEHVEESDEPELRSCYRLALQFNRRDWGRLRELIDRVNGADSS